RNTALDAVAKARKGEGPALILAHTVRLLAHSSSDDQRKYRSEADLASDRALDPLPRLEQHLISTRLITTEGISKIQKEAIARIDRAAELAQAEPQQDPATLLDHVYAPIQSNPPGVSTEPQHPGKSIVLVDAINHALFEEM